MNYERALDFLNRIGGDVCVVFHCDADGVSSAAQVLKYLATRNIRPSLSCGELEEDTFKKAFESQYAIILDMPVDSRESIYTRLPESLVIDHHPPQRNLNDIMIHINPRFQNPDIYISTSEIVCEMFKEVNLDFSWLARIGGCGDRSIKNCTEKEILATRVIDAYKAIEGERSLEKIALELSMCRGIDDFVSKRKHVEMVKRLESEVSKWVEQFNYKGKTIHIFEIDTPYSITSIVANRIFDMHPDITLLVYCVKGKIVKFSGRSREVDIGRVFREASEGIGSGGGHEVAAGARVSVEHVDLFLERVVKIYKRLKGKE
jgi:single-stranded DNA-specific DHH superfamily exonuclease